MKDSRRLTDRKREAIIQAAIAEFRANGFEGTSVDKVAARAEVSKRTLYNHFQSKDELFAEVLQTLWQATASQLEQPYRPGLPLRDQLLELLMRKMTVMADANFLDLARVAIAVFIHSPARAQEMVERLSQQENAILAWVRAAQRDGQLKSGDADQAVQQLESLVKGAAFWPQVAMGQPALTAESQQQVASAAVDMFLSYYAA